MLDFVRKFPNPEALSRQQVIQVCREKRGILVISDEGYTSVLRIDVKVVWGVILLPRDVESQTQLWRKMSSGNLTFRPTNETVDLVEYAKRNRMLLDIRQDPPILTLHSDCRWLSHPSGSH